MIDCGATMEQHLPTHSNLLLPKKCQTIVGHRSTKAAFQITHNKLS